jgi:hypothetical protein
VRHPLPLQLWLAVTLTVSFLCRSALMAQHDNPGYHQAPGTTSSCRTALPSVKERVVRLFSVPLSHRRLPFRDFRSRLDSVVSSFRSQLARTGGYPRAGVLSRNVAATPAVCSVVNRAAALPGISVVKIVTSHPQLGHDCTALTAAEMPR